MKVVLVGPVYPYRGGIAHYTTMLFRALEEQEHRVLLVSFKRQYPRWLFPGQSDRDPSEKPLQVKNARYLIDSLNPFTWLKAFRSIGQFQPDAIVLQWWTTFWAPVWLVLGLLNRILLDRPLIFICHNVLPHEAHWWDFLLTKFVLRWGSRFVVQSGEEERRLLALLPEASVKVLPHPVYDMFADQKMSKEAARRKLRLPENAPVLLFFGMVRAYKGLQDLLAAMPEIQKALSKVSLLVAGEFWEDKRPYLETIERLGLDDSVIIHDEYILNEMLGVYFSAADLLVAPFRRRTGSGSVQMARGFGLPVVATWKEPEAAGDVDDGTWQRVPPGDVKQLASAIIRFFERGSNSGSCSRQRRIARETHWPDLARAIEESVF